MKATLTKYLNFGAKKTGTLIFGCMAALVALTFVSFLSLFNHNDQRYEDINRLQTRLNDFSFLINRQNIGNIGPEWHNLIDLDFETLLSVGGKGLFRQESTKLDGKLLGAVERLSESWSMVSKNVSAFQGVEIGERNDSQISFLQEDLQMIVAGIGELKDMAKREEKKNAIIWVSITLLMALCILISLGLIIKHNIFRPLVAISGKVNTIIKGKDTHGEIIELDQINRELDALSELFFQATAYAKGIANGDAVLDVSIEKNGAHFNRRNALVKALLDMKSKMDVAAQEEKERNWYNESIAKIDQILRKNYGDLDDLSNALISGLVNIINANQGSFYILEGEGNEGYLEMSACYAFGRRKFIKSKIEPGHGLLGQAILDKEMIFITDVPQAYVKITSGLGEAAPSSVLIVPLLFNGEVYGVIELASFKVFQDYEQHFVNSVCENIAAKLSVDKVNLRTKVLLSEAQEMTEELRAQEEEMRQNMEELHATQEEISIKQVALEANQKMMEDIINLVPFPIFVKDNKGCYFMVNSAQEDLVGFSKEFILKKADNDLIADPTEIKKIIESDSKVLIEGEKVVLPEQIVTFSNGKQRFLKTFKVPFNNPLTKELNILGVSIDNTEQRIAQQKIYELELALEKHKNC